MNTKEQARHRASSWLAWGVTLLLMATIVAIGVQMARSPKPSIPKVMIGTRDQVYYSQSATMQQATVLGHALESTGFFNDRGSSVMLTKNRGVTTISFVVNEGAWNQPDTVDSFEEIARRVAGSVGGFPVQVHLVDTAWTVKKSLAVGRATSGTRDVIYYLGSATEADAKALGRALREAGYLEDLGVSVAVAKGNGTSIGFVVGDGVWDRPEAVAGFTNLARRVAASVGGLPVQLRLLNAEMEIKKETAVR